jgi:hypothetical protein
MSKDKKAVDTFVRWEETEKVELGLQVYDLLDTLTGATYRFLSELGRELKKQQILQQERRKGINQ